MRAVVVFLFFGKNVGMTIKTTSIMIIHLKRESDCGGNERGYSEKQRQRKGGSQIKNVEYILGHLLEKAMDRGGIKSSLRINNKRERERIQCLSTRVINKLV